MRIARSGVLISRSMALEFQWDPQKAKTNAASHGVSFQEALTVFADPLARIFDDPGSSYGENRELIVGHSHLHNLLVVCFVERDNRTRLISARKATRAERKDYEKNDS